MFSGQKPFHAYSDGDARKALAREERPSKPAVTTSTGFDAEVWSLILDCWSSEPSLRPPIDQVESRVKAKASSITPVKYHNEPIGVASRNERKESQRIGEDPASLQAADQEAKEEATRQVQEAEREAAVKTDRIAKQQEARKREAEEKEAREREAMEQEARDQQGARDRREARERAAEEQEAKDREAKEREVRKFEVKQPVDKEQEARKRESREQEESEEERERMTQDREARAQKENEQRTTRKERGARDTLFSMGASTSKDLEPDLERILKTISPSDIEQLSNQEGSRYIEELGAVCVISSGAYFHWLAC
jgi:hypothetical protein